MLAEWNRISKGFFFVREENYRLRRLGDRSKISQNFPTRVKLSNKTICGINNRKKRYKSLRNFLTFNKTNEVLLKESILSANIKKSSRSTVTLSEKKRYSGRTNRKQIQLRYLCTIKKQSRLMQRDKCSIDHNTSLPPIKEYQALSRKTQ